MYITIAIKGTPKQYLRVESYRDAAASWAAQRDLHGIGASGMRTQCGEIRTMPNGKGQLLAVVAYNGRILVDGKPIDGMNGGEWIAAVQTADLAAAAVVAQAAWAAAKAAEAAAKAAWANFDAAKAAETTYRAADAARKAAYIAALDAKLTAAVAATTAADARAYQNTLAQWEATAAAEAVADVEVAR
jgi:hypothetical protein